ncbi:YdcF family protein [Streptomyces sp. A1-5]|uniref:YdcF family protein n=1 Tax=Streptomyces sp. A1-5 TaxID=2738410 RepID=UPI001F2DB103|nr:YdcF family protein [Streptomyces sp. A1-5]UJB42749.1 YdcF family protein [Streptomyces sp. A1-5]
MIQGVPVPDREQRTITDAQWNDAQVIWDFHQMGHEPRPCSAAICLGSHDLGAATFAARQYHAGLFPVLVFSGGNSPTTADLYPRGEAVHFREHALDLGVPDSAILLEPNAGNTGQNITFSRDVLLGAGVEVGSVMLIAMPYMERRAYATCRKVWPEADVVCASDPLDFADYVKSIGDERLVIDTMVGDLQRVIKYPKLGFAIEQEVPDDVLAAYKRLLHAGFDSRLFKS